MSAATELVGLGMVITMGNKGGRSPGGLPVADDRALAVSGGQSDNIVLGNIRTKYRKPLAA